MTAITIDFEVFKALTALRRSEAISCNDVLRELLGLPDAAQARPNQGAAGTGGFTSMGVVFPQGTSFRALYKRKYHYAEAIDGGLLVAENHYRATSLSGAARSITHNNVDGWRFWECRFPGESDYTPISSLRVGGCATRPG